MSYIEAKGHFKAGLTLAKEKRGGDASQERLYAGLFCLVAAVEEDLENLKSDMAVVLDAVEKLPKKRRS